MSFVNRLCGGAPCPNPACSPPLGQVREASKYWEDKNLVGVFEIGGGGARGGTIPPLIEEQMPPRGAKGITGLSRSKRGKGLAAPLMA